MIQTSTEFEILKEIDEKLSAANPDAQQRILDWVIAKYKAEYKKEKPAIGHGSSLSNQSELSSKDFLLSKKPGNHYERIACIVYFLEKYTELKGAKTLDISKANNEARQPNIPNAALYVKHATNTYGYLTSIGNGKKGISAKGEALVEALPDREKVTFALKDHMAKKKSPRKTKAKK
jgi:hypothetical protein